MKSTQKFRQKIMNKLSDSLRLIICAGSTSWAECREANLSCSAKKQKDSHVCDCLFGGAGEI